VTLKAGIAIGMGFDHRRFMENALPVVAKNPIRLFGGRMISLGDTRKQLSKTSSLGVPV
jgi:hypothetical protein